MNEEYMIPKSRVYILINENNIVTRIEGDDSLPSNLTDWIKIDEGYGDRYNLAQGHYLEKPLMTEDGIYQYKYEDNEIKERTEEEIEEDRQNIPIIPTWEDRIESQIY